MSYPWTQLTYMGMATPQGKTRIYGELKPSRENTTIPSLIAIQTPFNISSHLDNEDISLLSYKVITHKTMYLTFPSHFKRITSSMCSLWAKIFLLKLVQLWDPFSENGFLVNWQGQSKTLEGTLGPPVVSLKIT